MIERSLLASNQPTHSTAAAQHHRETINTRDAAIAGFFVLLPLYVMLLIIGKAWKALHSFGAGVAGILGVPPILGVHSNTIFTALLSVSVWIVFGLLVRFTFVGAVSGAAEGTIAKYVPDYAKYKSMAEEKLQRKVKVLDYTSALIRWQEYWRPAYIVEQDKDGNCVLFLPDVPETTRGMSYWPNVTSSELCRPLLPINSTQH